MESWLKKIGLLGEEAFIDEANSEGDVFCVKGVNGNTVEVNISNNNIVHVYNLHGASAMTVSGNGNHFLNLPAHNVYLFQAKDTRTGKHLTRTIML